MSPGRTNAWTETFHSFCDSAAFAVKLTPGEQICDMLIIILGMGSFWITDNDSCFAMENRWVQLMGNWWFGIRIGVPLSNNPFHKGILSGSKPPGPKPTNLPLVARCPDSSFGLRLHLPQTKLFWRFQEIRRRERGTVDGRNPKQPPGMSPQNHEKDWFRPPKN